MAVNKNNAIKKNKQADVVTSKHFHDTVRELNNVILRREGQIAERDKLIGMMFEGHIRDVQVSNLHRKNVIALSTLFSTFQKTFSTFKESVLEDTFQNVQFDKAHQKAANEIQALFMKIEDDKHNSGPIAQIPVQDVGKSLMSNHVDQYKN